MERFTIYNENTGGTPRENRSNYDREQALRNQVGGADISPTAPEAAPDATQRVYIDPSSSIPTRRPAPQRREPSRPATQAGRRTAPRKKASQRKKDKITLITLGAIAGVLIIAIIIALLFMSAPEEDDGLILNNVIVAGVNLGGKTPEQAQLALQEATKDTYSKLDMVVEVHNSKEVLTPSQTGAKLDIAAAVEAAYNYGRTGSQAERQQAKKQSMSSSYVLSIIPYLNLDTDYIQSVVNKLGSEYSSTLSQPSYRVEGMKPDLPVDTSGIDVETAHQTLIITMGTAEYGLDTGKLYNQILEAYNNNLFQVVGEISVVTPGPLDLQAIYSELCTAPIDAVLNETTYEVTPEVYGYGFQLDAVSAQVESASYGDKIRVPLTFIRPQLTAEDLSEGLFEKIIANYTTAATEDKDIILNLKLAARNFPKEGLILKVGEEFSFNDFLGMLTEAKGYKEAADITGTPVLGGGVSRLSSALYYCALTANMEVSERTSHKYAPDFIDLGLDADIAYGSADLVFTNTTGRPVRIEVSVNDSGCVKVDIWGTVNDELTTEILYETVNTYKPSTLTNVMLEDNPGGLKAGDVLVKPITGYDVCTYIVYRYTNADPDSEPVKLLVAVSQYAKQDEVIVDIQKFPPPTDPTDPSEGEDGTSDPSISESSGASESSETTEATTDNESSFSKPFPY